jgi:hypothetical protein
MPRVVVPICRCNWVEAHRIPTGKRYEELSGVKYLLMYGYPQYTPDAWGIVFDKAPKGTGQSGSLLVYRIINRPTMPTLDAVVQLGLYARPAAQYIPIFAAERTRSGITDGYTVMRFLLDNLKEVQ